MPTKRTIHNREIGQLRIYFAGHERNPSARRGWRRLLPGTRLYKDIIAAAKADGGILNATAHFTHYGYSGHGDIHQTHPETGDNHLTLCVELVGDRTVLERFCRAHAELLGDRVLLYKHLEHWSFQPHGLAERPATRKELSMPLE